MKPIVFLGDSIEQLRAFPDAARRDSGFQLDRLQRGLDPDDWKPMKSIGSGVREIRIRDANGTFRVVFLATLPDAVYVLHAFQKKTSKTSTRDIAVAQFRYRELKRST